jgi:hypothetical protein
MRQQSILCSHPLTRRYLRFLLTYSTVENTRVQRQSWAEDHYIYLVNTDGTASFAGTIGIFNINATLELRDVGIMVGESA